jgi:hypothetical protein
VPGRGQEGPGKSHQTACVASSGFDESDPLDAMKQRLTRVFGAFSGLFSRFFGSGVTVALH